MSMTSFYVNQRQGYIHLGMEIIQMKQQNENTNAVYLIQITENNHQEMELFKQELLSELLETFIKEIESQFSEN